MANAAFGDRGAPRNYLEESMADEKTRRRQLRGQFTADYAVVIAYYPLTQTVDASLLVDPGAGIFRNVPIAGAGGNGLRFIRPLRALGQHPEPDIGYLMFPRLDGTEALSAFPEDGVIPPVVQQPARRRTVSSTDTHTNKGPVFVPGLPVGLQTNPPNLTDDEEAAIDEIGPLDAALVDENGYGFILKSGGNPTIIVEDHLNVLRRGQGVGDLKQVGRDGDGAVSSLSASGLIRSG